MAAADPNRTSTPTQSDGAAAAPSKQVQSGDAGRHHGRTGHYVYRPLEPLGSETWGDESLTFEVAGLPFLVTGLNRFQKDWLREHYATSSAQRRAVEICFRRAVPELFAETFKPGHAFDLELTPHDGALWLDGPRFRACFPVPIPSDFASGSCVARVWTPEAEGEWLEGVFANLFRVGLAVAVVPRGSLLLHSSGFLLEDAEPRAVLAFAPSGTGKSTLARHAMNAGARVLSDDLNLIHAAGDGYATSAVPYAGELGSEPGYEFAPGRWPLAAVVRLRQGDEIAAKPLASPAAGVAQMLACAPFVNVDEQLLPQLETNLEGLLRCVPALELTLPKDAPFEEIRAALEPHLAS